MSQLLKKIRTVPVRLTQNSLININSSVPITVRVVPKWRDDGVVQLEELVSSEGDKSKIRWVIQENNWKKVGLSSINLSIFNSDVAPSILNNESISYEFHHDETNNNNINDLVLIASVPEKCNVRCRLNNGGDIFVHGKLEAEDGFSFLTKGGSIVVDKLRGNDIYLEAAQNELQCGTINIKKSCEAQNLNIIVGKRGRLRAKMLNVSNSVIEVQDSDEVFDPFDIDDTAALIDISSIYTSFSGEGASLIVQKSQDASIDESFRKVRVKSSHGHISVRASSSFSTLQQSIRDSYDQRLGYIELGGINGSFDVTIEKLQKDTISKAKPNQLPFAAKIHIDSLSPNRANLLTSDFGDISMTLDRKLETDIRLFSSKHVDKLKPELLLEEDEKLLMDTLEALDLELDRFSSHNAELSPFKMTMINTKTEGFINGRDAPPAMKYIEFVRGVIENKSNEPDSRFETKTKSGGKIRIEEATSQALHGFSGGKIDGKDFLPLLCVATDGKICVESLSWFGAIAKRYGIDREPINLGRRAGARSSDFSISK